MKLLKKNQFVVTVLALLIAVAGYLNYADKLEEKSKSNTYEEIYKQDDLIASNDDILSLDTDAEISENSDVVNEEAVKNEVTEKAADDAGDVNENDGNSEVKEEAKEEETGEIGEAVLTNGASMSSFTIQAKVNREQVRSKNKDTLLEIINNDNLPNEQKSEAVESMVKMTERSEMENNIETILEAKGYADVVVTIDDNQADILINSAQVTDNDRAVIEDVVTRKMDLELSNIVITPMSGN